jgi:DNA-binding beta-propeller fold protein YncE
LLQVVLAMRKARASAAVICRRSVHLLVVTLVASCGGSATSPRSDASSAADARSSDAGASDSNPPADLGIVDAATTDLGPPDVPEPDALVADAASEQDAAAPDASTALVCAADTNLNTFTAYSIAPTVPPIVVRRFGAVMPTAVAEDSARGEVYIATDTGDQITAYTRSLAPLRALSLDAPPIRIAIDSTHDELWAVEALPSGASAISVFPGTATGAAAPLRRLEGASLDRASAIGVSVQRDEIFVAAASPDTGAILVFARTASGASSPLRVIHGPSTGVVFPQAIAIDATHGEIAIAHYYDASRADLLVSTFAIDASGDVPPLRSLYVTSGAPPSVDLAIDDTRDELLVATGQIELYPRTASGNRAPSRTLDGPATFIALDASQGELVTAARTSRWVRAFTGTSSRAGTLGLLQLPQGSLNGPRTLTVDAARNQVWLALQSVTRFGCVTQGYALDAIGPGPPVHDLGICPNAVAVDTVHDELILLQDPKLFFLQAAAGAGPIRTLSSPSLARAGFIAVDPVHDEVFASDQASSELIVVPRTSTTSTVTALRRIAGAHTGLAYPLGIALDLVHDEVWVANEMGGSINIYARGGDGDVAPVRRISGPHTQLGRVQFVSLDVERDEIAATSLDGDAIMFFARTADGDVAPLRTLGVPFASFSGVEWCR